MIADLKGGDRADFTRRAKDLGVLSDSYNRIARSLGANVCAESP